jgi:hypothetical protein
MKKLDIITGDIKTTKVGCNPAAPWWKQAWLDAKVMAPEAGDNLGLIGLINHGTQAVFQIRGVGCFIVELECE